MLLLSTALQTVSDLDFLHLNPVPMNQNDATHEKLQHPYGRKEQVTQRPQSNPRGKYVSYDSQSLMKRPVTSILDPGFVYSWFEKV